MKVVTMCGNEKIRRLERAIKRRETLARAGTVAKLLLGVPLTFVGPVLLALVVQAVLWDRFDFHVALWRVMVCTSVASVPLLMWTEVRRGERFLVEESQGAPPVAGLLTPLAGQHLAMMGVGPAVILANRERFCASVIEILLAGPRLVVGALREVRLAVRLGRADAARTASLLAELLARREGVELKLLQLPGEPLEKVLRALNQLICLGWAAVSAREPRAYIYSEARRNLKRLVGQAGEGD